MEVSCFTIRNEFTLLRFCQFWFFPLPCTDLTNLFLVVQMQKVTYTFCKELHAQLLLQLTLEQFFDKPGNFCKNPCNPASNLLHSNYILNILAVGAVLDRTKLCENAGVWSCKTLMVANISDLLLSLPVK